MLSFGREHQIKCERGGLNIIEKTEQNITRIAQTETKREASKSR